MSGFRLQFLCWLLRHGTVHTYIKPTRAKLFVFDIVLLYLVFMHLQVLLENNFFEGRIVIRDMIKLPM